MGITPGLSDPILTRLVAEDKVPWYKKKNLRFMYLCLAFGCMGVEMTSGFDSTLIGTLQFSPPWNKFFTDGAKDASGNPVISPALLGFVSSCYQLGSIIGVPIAPWASQRFGRRWSIMVGSLIMCAGALIQGFSQDLGMYIFSRMLLGFGIVFCIIAGSALTGELGYPKERPILTSLFNSSYFIGQITAAAISLKTSDITNDWSWRLPSILQLCPSLLQIIFVFFLPESPRWLISKDRSEEAFDILVKYHSEGDVDSLVVKAEMAQIQSTIKLELEHSKQSWFELFKTPGMRRRVLVSSFVGLFGQMSGNTLLSYYQNLLYIMMGYTSTYAKTRINLANACWSFLTATAAALVVAKFKRRMMFLLSAVSMLLVFIAMTVSFEQLRVAKNNNVTNSAAGVAALFFYFAYQPCYNIGNNALTYTYLIELFPYSQRSQGIGIQQIFGKAGGFFSNNVNPIALSALDWKFLAIYCGWISFEALFIYFFYPETQGRTLEELTFLFEDKSLADQAVTAVEKRIHYDGDVNDPSKTAVVTVEDIANKAV